VIRRSGFISPVFFYLLLTIPKLKKSLHHSYKARFIFSKN